MRPDGSTLRAIAADPPALLLALGALIAAAWAARTPATADLAAQAYRSNLFATQGFLLWDTHWYGGHYLPGYSLLFPPLGAAVGLRLSGIVLVALAALLFAAVLRTTDVPRRRLASAWLATALTGELLIGRLTFLMGLTVALGAVLLLARGRPRAAGAVAALATVSSPVAGLFLVLVGAAVFLRGRRTAGTLTMLGAGLPLAAIALVAPEGGVQPFSTAGFAVAAGLTVLFLWLVRARPGVVRTAAWLYLAAVVVCFVVPSPVGSNVVRLGVLFAGPALVTCAVPVSTLARAAVVALVAWQAYGPVTEVAKSVATPSDPSVYAPLLAQLDRRHATAGRVEIVPTATRWEVVNVAVRFPLARGWESQLDRQRNPLFFGDAPLDARSYHSWLRRNAVRFVVIPRIPLAQWGRREARLVVSGLAYLRPVWRDPDWALYAVTDPTALAAGPAAGVTMTHDAITFTATAPGTVTLRAQYTPYWTVTAGRACVRPGGRRLTRVRVDAPGRVVVTARLGDGSRCR